VDQPQTQIFLYNHDCIVHANQLTLKETKLQSRVTKMYSFLNNPIYIWI